MAAGIEGVGRLSLPSPTLAVWVGTPSKSPPIQTLEGCSQAITPVIDRAAHHSEGPCAFSCQQFVAEGDDQAAD